MRHLRHPAEPLHDSFLTIKDEDKQIFNFESPSYWPVTSYLTKIIHFN